MADDKDKSQHQQNIKRILTRCSQQKNSKQDQLYFKEKDEQVRSVHQSLIYSVNLLKIAQDGVQFDPQQNMRVSGLELPREIQVSRIKTKMNRFSDQSRKSNFYSALSHRKSSSLKSQTSPPRSRRQEGKNNLNSQRLSLPNLVSKIKKNKKPANASKNSSLQFLDNKKAKVEENVSYEHVRSQRQKVQQMRRLNVLGRLMGQNYKKHMKKLDERRKLFLRHKMNNQF